MLSVLVPGSTSPIGEKKIMRMSAATRKEGAICGEQEGRSQLQDKNSGARREEVLENLNRNRGRSSLEAAATREGSSY